MDADSLFIVYVLHESMTQQVELPSQSNQRPIFKTKILVEWHPFTKVVDILEREDVDVLWCLITITVFVFCVFLFLLFLLVLSLLVFERLLLVLPLFIGFLKGSMLLFEPLRWLQILNLCRFLPVQHPSPEVLHGTVLLLPLETDIIKSLTFFGNRELAEGLIQHLRSEVGSWWRREPLLLFLLGELNLWHGLIRFFLLFLLLLFLLVLLRLLSRRLLLFLFSFLLFLYFFLLLSLFRLLRLLRLLGLGLFLLWLFAPLLPLLLSFCLLFLLLLFLCLLLLFLLFFLFCFGLCLCFLFLLCRLCFLLGFLLSFLFLRLFLFLLLLLVGLLPHLLQLLLPLFQLLLALLLLFALFPLSLGLLLFDLQEALILHVLPVTCWFTHDHMSHLFVARMTEFL
mmetsp:Transcript_116421/g.217957  ORF Transcript_116421/g.217957 Transcript_116421/m.217957 type:complete len:397 (-) Transcript_116421:380-1570(-)